MVGGMKKLLVILLVLAALGVGFLAGTYYEAHRPLEPEDVQRFQQRLADRAGDWAGEMSDRMRRLLGGAG